MPKDSTDEIQELRRYCSSNSLNYHIETYGCQMNVRDSETLSGMLEELGYTPAETIENADLILFNTCCVRDHAEARVRSNVGALRERRTADPRLRIGVCGCMMQQDGVAEKLYKRYPFVDFLFGTHNISDFPRILASATLSGESVVEIEDTAGIVEGLPAKRAGGVAAFVTIMYGCDNFCSYCVVPYVRGRERSREKEDILEEISALAKSGKKEITLLGQNVNSFKLGGYGSDSFAMLLREVCEVPGIERVRFMTSHPKDVPESLLSFIASEKKMARQLHLPVQSGSDAVLSAMNRGYTRNEYIKLAERIRETIPGAELTTDVIVGFPGETERDFLDTLELVKQVGFTSAYTFKFSPRKGTKAATMPNQLEKEVIRERLGRLNALLAEKKP